MRHFPTMLEFPQPVIAHSKMVATVIRNLGLEKTNGMTVDLYDGCACHVERSRAFPITSFTDLK
jgi:hypothetical protein